MTNIKSGILSRFHAPITKLALSLCAIGIASAAQAADNVWEGDDDGYWETEANWTNPSGDYWKIEGSATSKSIKFKTQASHAYNFAIAIDGVTFSGDDANCGLNQSASDVRIGTWAYGSLTIESGSHTFNELAVPSAWWGSAQNGDLTINGGSLTVNNYAGIGAGNAENASGSVGNINVNGGSVTFAANLRVGDFAGGTGNLYLNSGTVTTAGIYNGGGTGSVVFNGGTAVATTAADGDFIPAADNYTVTIGNSGGTISNANDIKITAAVTGSGWLTKTGAGTLRLSNVAGFTGRIAVAENAGTVTLPATATNIKVGLNTTKAVTSEGIEFTYSATDYSNADNYWTGNGEGNDWATTGNWENGLVGANNFVFHSSRIGGTPVSVEFADAYTGDASLYIENGTDGVVTFAKASGAGATAGVTMSGGIIVGTGTSGSLSVADGAYSAGWVNIGSRTGEAALSVSDGTLSCGGDFNLGINGASARLAQTGGAITSGAVGWWGADNSKAVADINGGSVSFAGNLNLLNQNNNSGIDSSYITNNIAGGALSANEIWFLGNAGHATVNLSSGTVATGLFGVSGSAIYAINITGGTLKATADNAVFLPSSDKLTVTVTGNATLDTDGKTITIDAAMLGDGTLTCVGGGTVTFTSLDSTCTIVADGATVNQPAVITWTGNGDGESWNDEDNWSNGAVPTGSDVIRFSSNADIVVKDSDGSVNDIIIDDGVELGLTINGKYLYLSGDISGAGKLVLGNTTGLYFNNGAQTVSVDIDVKEGSSITFIAKRGTASNVFSGNLTGAGAITARIDSKNTNGGGFTFNGDASGFSGTVLLDCNGNARPNMYINAASSDNSGSSWTLNLGTSYDGGGSSYTSYFPLRSSNCIYKFGGLNGTIPWAKGGYGWLTGVTLQVGGLDGDCELDGDWGNVSASGLDWAAASATMTYGLKNNSFINVTKGGTLKITSAEVMRTSSSTITYSGANGTLKIASDVDFDPSTYLVASGSVAIIFDDEGVSREWSGDLAGIYAFTKDGSGTLTLSSAPAYSGPTKVLAGKLVVPFGTAMSTLELGDNATVEVDMTDAAANATAFSVGKIVGDKTKVSLVNNTSGVEFTLVETANGFVYVNGSKSYTWVGPTGDSNWSTAANWGQETDIPTSADTVAIPGSMEVYIDMAAAALAITANGDLTIIGPSNAKTTLAATSLVVDGNLTVSNYVELVIGAMNVSGKITMVQNNIDSNSYADTLGDANVGNMDIKNGFSGSGVLLNDGSLELTGNDTFIGTIGGGQSVTKKGDATYMLIGNNTFTGGLAIEKGTLKLGSPKDIADVRMDFDASDVDSFTVDEVTGYVTAWKDQINNLFFNYASGQHATISTDFFGGKNAFSMTDTEESIGEAARRVTNYKLSESNKDRRSKMMFIAYQSSLANEAYRSIYTEDQQRNFRIHVRGNSSAHYWCWHNGGSQNQITSGFYMNDVYGNGLVTQNPQVLGVADSLIRNKTGGSAQCYDVLGSYAETAECFKGGIGEIISYNRNLTHAERKAVDAYLMAKWGAGSATYNVIPATADVTMAAGATLDMGGLTQTVKSFTGAGTVTNGYLKTTGDLTVDGGTLTIQATTGQTYVLSDVETERLVLTGNAKGYTIKVPENAKIVGRFVVPEGISVGFDGAGADVTVVNAPKGWSITGKTVAGGILYRVGSFPFVLKLR